ncbi:MAG: B12-binding domain-containing radical SAM protein [Acidobacteria bacterium]|nr:B12-binding domain-containing radical SAM protein [Acidobacteriota bacterium]
MNDNQDKDNRIRQEKILLLLLPYWTPLIPPMGLACIKSHLQKYGYNVKAKDANILNRFREISDSYLKLLGDYIPVSKKGNFGNIAGGVFAKHIMACLNYRDENQYNELVGQLVNKTFFHQLQDNQVRQLNKIAAGFYDQLETYLIDLLEEEKPTVLGISVYTATAAASLFAFKLVKEKFPHIKTVMGGGIFCGDLDLGSPNYQFFLEKAPFIDAIIVGEGEQLFLKYLRGEPPASGRVYTLKDLENHQLDLDETHLPDFSDFELRYYPSLGAYTSRSCPFQCTFCSEVIMWGKYRKKKAAKVVAELKTLSGKYKEQLFLMSDSLLNPIITDLANEFINSDLAIYWDGYLRADKPVCDTNNTMVWRRGGFYRARLGLESGSERILNAMGKKITPQQLKTAVSSLAYAGIKTTTYWVIGYPRETEEDFQQTLNLIEELKDDIYEADCNPFIYYLSGQVNSKDWNSQGKSILLYPENAREMLIIQTWILDGLPTREETFRRLNRFVEHCRDIGIPNPYSMTEIYEADERWKKLHKNAVPSLVEFLANKDSGQPFINECKHIKEIVMAEKVKMDEGGWGF